MLRIFHMFGHRHFSRTVPAGLLETCLRLRTGEVFAWFTPNAGPYDGATIPLRDAEEIAAVSSSPNAVSAIYDIALLRNELEIQA